MNDVIQVSFFLLCHSSALQKNSIMWPLKGLLQNISDAWMYLVYPPGVTGSSILIYFNNFLTGHLSYKSVLSQKPLLEGKGTNNSFKCGKASISFIQTFEDDATTQQYLKNLIYRCCLWFSILKNCERFHFRSIGLCSQTDTDSHFSITSRF